MLARTERPQSGPQYLGGVFGSECQASNISRARYRIVNGFPVPRIRSSSSCFPVSQAPTFPVSRVYHLVPISTTVGRPCASDKGPYTSLEGPYASPEGSHTSDEVTDPASTGSALFVTALAWNASLSASARTKASHSTRLFFTSTSHRKTVLAVPLGDEGYVRWMMKRFIG